MAISPAVDAQQVRPSPDVSTPAPAPEETAGPADARFRIALLGLLVVALLAASGTLVWLLAERRGTADDVQGQRDAVMRQTEQFVLRLNTYGPDQLDAKGHLPTYRKQVVAVITAKFATDFEKSGLPIAEQTVAQSGYGRTVKVFGVGVDSIDSDSATAIIAAGFTGSTPDPQHPKNAAKRVKTDEQVLRWKVDLVRTDGAWRVDDYAPVTTEASR
jgi:Mce-associated membrane protein